MIILIAIPCSNKKSRELIVAHTYCPTSRLFVLSNIFLILRDIKGIGGGLSVLKKISLVSIYFIALNNIFQNGLSFSSIPSGCRVTRR